MMDEFDEWDYYEKLADRCADIHLQKEEDWFRYIEDDFENFVWAFRI